MFSWNWMFTSDIGIYSINPPGTLKAIITYERTSRLADVTTFGGNFNARVCRYFIKLALVWQKDQLGEIKHRKIILLEYSEWEGSDLKISILVLNTDHRSTQIPNHLSISYKQIHTTDENISTQMASWQIYIMRIDISFKSFTRPSCGRLIFYGGEFSTEIQFRKLFATSSLFTLQMLEWEIFSSSSSNFYSSDALCYFQGVDSPSFPHCPKYKEFHADFS